jgi:hypothetical protein
MSTPNVQRCKIAVTIWILPQVSIRRRIDRTAYIVVLVNAVSPNLIEQIAAVSSIKMRLRDKVVSANQQPDHRSRYGYDNTDSGRVGIAQSRAAGGSDSSTGGETPGDDLPLAEGDPDAGDQGLSGVLQASEEEAACKQDPWQYGAASAELAAGVPTM